MAARIRLLPAGCGTPTTILEAYASPTPDAIRRTASAAARAVPCGLPRLGSRAARRTRRARGAGGSSRHRASRVARAVLTSGRSPTFRSEARARGTPGHTSVTTTRRGARSCQADHRKRGDRRRHGAGLRRGLQRGRLRRAVSVPARAAARAGRAAGRSRVVDGQPITRPRFGSRRFPTGPCSAGERRFWRPSGRASSGSSPRSSEPSQPRSRLRPGLRC